MYANRITITEVEQLAREMFENCTITDYCGMHKINLGNGQVIYANDRFVDEFHKELLKQAFTKKFENTYNKYYHEN